MYEPSFSVLQKYASILVNFALNSGAGVKPKQVVQVLVPDVAKPMYGALQTAILKAKAYPLMRFLPTGFTKSYFTEASTDQLQFFPKKYLKSRTDLIDHSIGILADHDLYELVDVNPQKIILSAEAQKPLRRWLTDKEYAGRFTWTAALYGTPAMAKEVGLSLAAYWDQIIAACFLDASDPIAKWQAVALKQDRIKTALNALPIHTLHLTAKDTDIYFTLGEKRQFVGGGGRNIPSFEIFTSPDWRGTEGKITFNQPFYRYGTIIDGIRLTFVKGRVVEAKARHGQKLLSEIVKRPNADKIGEFSLTEGKMSRITHFMANTLFDENIGGPEGNMHLAIGLSYKDAYAGNPASLPPKTWRDLGFNESGEHCDFVTTTARVVTARLTNGTNKIIYSKGRFRL